MAVDELAGKLAGLIMAEVELTSGEARWANPPLAIAHVTADDRFSGGTLAVSTTAQNSALLTGLGVRAVVTGLRRETAIHRQHGTGRISGLVGADEGDGGGDLLRGGEPHPAHDPV
jgi:hypothetical protein